jgi:hypothetical protein
VHEPFGTYAQISGPVLDASVGYTETLRGEYYELPNTLVDRVTSVNYWQPEEAAVSSDYIEDAQMVLDINYNIDDNLSHYSNYAHDHVNSYNAPPAALPVSAMINLSGQSAFPAPALPRAQFSGFISTVTVRPTQPSGANALTCPLGCRGTFGRPSEYRRHWKKHEGRDYACMQPGCSRSFHMKDKLRDHLRQGHKITHYGRAHAAAVTGVQSAAASSRSG